MTSSLEILKPRPWASRKRAWVSDTAKQIAQASCELIVVASARDWSNPAMAKWVDGEHRAQFDHADGVPINNFQQYVAHHERLVAAYPEYRFEVLDSVADVYEETGTGQVFLLLRVTGHPPDTVRESIMVMYWKRVDELWRCRGQRVVRGIVMS